MALEDYNTYTKSDPLSRYTVTTNKIVVTDIENDDPNQYVAFDYSATPFDGDFTHRFKLTVTMAGGGFIYPWCLAKEFNDIAGLTDALFLQHNGGAALLKERVSGTDYQDFTVGFSAATPYWYVPDRDEVVGSFGQQYCFIYEDEDETIIFDTLTLALHIKEDFSHVNATIGGGSGSSANISGDIENLDLGLDGVAVTLVRKGLGRGLNRGTGRGL